MLRSLGLFKTTACPHCVAGLCSRPNCFLSHKKTDIENAKQKSGQDKLRTPLDESLPLPVSAVQSVQKENGSGVKTIPQEVQPHVHQSDTSLSDKDDINRLSINAVKVQNSRKRSHEKDDDLERVSPKGVKKLKSEQHVETLTIKTDPELVQKNMQSPRPKAHNKPALVSQVADISTDIKVHALIDGEITIITKLRSDAKGKDKRHSQSKHRTTPQADNSKEPFDKCNSFLASTEVTDDASKAAIADKEEVLNDFNSDDELSSEFLYPDDSDGLDDDPDQIAFECLQMFNNYKPTTPGKPKSNSTHTKDSTEPGSSTSESSRKKRLAHATSAGMSEFKKLPMVSTKSRISATEAMLHRYEKIKAQAPNVKKTGSCSNEVPVLKKRIAHVANVSSLLKPQLSPKKPISGSSSITLAQTAAKGQPRQAHTPKQLPDSFELPKISFESTRSSKVPVVVRQKILEQMFHECRKIYIEPEDAAERALAEEKDLSVRCSSKAVYFCSGTNAIARLRKEASQGTNGTQAGSKNSGVSHLSVLAGSAGARNSWSIESAKKMIWPPTGTLLYVGIKRYLLTEEQLEENGYPRKSPLGGGRAIAKSRSNTGDSGVVSNPLVRTCERCMKSYRVDLDGFPVVKQQCSYHSGRKFKRRVNGIIEGRYTCCDGDVATDGCCVSDYHVSPSTSNELRGFVTSVKDPGDEDLMGADPWDIVAIDCEMIYTTKGNELARATFIGSKSQVLYDELVKPIHPVLDYNSRFSGITEDMLKDTTITLTDVQAVLLTHLKPNTILVGHSLESDFLALKLIHNCVVDSSVLFPHRLGPPFKRALRNLATECLGKIIQMGEGGHDSAEDAKSALEVVLWKLKEDSKIQDCFSKL